MMQDYLSTIDRNTIYIATASLLLFLVVSWLTYFIRRNKGLNRKFFEPKWQEVLKLAAKKETWPQAIMEADKLLDLALKKRHFKGKTMGERLTDASREFRDIDATWKAHKLRNKVVHETDVTLRKRDVHAALKRFLNALKDLGAL